MPNKIIFFIIVCSVCGLFSCSHRIAGNLNICAYYRSNDGERIKVCYYTLEDESLSFVKIYSFNGNTLTLPRLLSASGERYGDDGRFVWWAKGTNAFFEFIDENGSWQRKNYVEMCAAQR